MEENLRTGHCGLVCSSDFDTCCGGGAQRSGCCGGIGRLRIGLHSLHCICSTWEHSNVLHHGVGNHACTSTHGFTDRGAVDLGEGRGKEGNVGLGCGPGEEIGLMFPSEDYPGQIYVSNLHLRYAFRELLFYLLDDMCIDY